MGEKTDVTIIESVSTICSGAFQNKPITKVVFSNISNVIKINPYAFKGCSSIQAIEIPPSIDQITEEMFYGCSKYPDCDFATWDKPFAKQCPDCGHPFLSEKTSKTQGTFLKCPACGYTEKVEKESTETETS
jgi:ssDNA-binding Zn-finger/Zn-ribbon topoisomerase 1